MMISYTYFPPTGCEQEVKDDLINFLLDMPSLFFLNYVPPIAVLNDVLASGGARCRHEWWLQVAAVCAG